MIWLCIYVSISVTNALRYYLYLGLILVEAFVSLRVLILHLTQLVVTGCHPLVTDDRRGRRTCRPGLGAASPGSCMWLPQAGSLQNPGEGPRGEVRSPGCLGQVPLCQPRGNPGHGRDERGRCRRGHWGTITLNRGVRSLALEPLVARALGWRWAPRRRPRFLPPVSGCWAAASGKHQGSQPGRGCPVRT